MSVRVDVRDRALRPVNEVFDAIIDASKIARYFPSHSSGPLVAGQSVRWTFADVGVELTIGVATVEPNRRIAFNWSATGAKTRVEIKLAADAEGATLIEITEDGWPLDEQGVKRALGQTQGWTDFICCMRADLEFGVRLRQGRRKRQ